MHICFITNKYPNFVEPNGLVFLQQLVAAIAAKGHRCTVICPEPPILNPRYLKLPKYTVDKYGDAEAEVYYPRYFGLGQRDYWKFNPAKLTTRHFSKALKRTIRKMKDMPDVFYAHFVTPAGIGAARMGRIFNRPVFMAFGEASQNTIRHFGFEAAKRELETLAGVVAVSTQNKELIEPFVKPGITEVFPNAIDNDLFYPRDKAAARKKY